MMTLEFGYSMSGVILYMDFGSSPKEIFFFNYNNYFNKFTLHLG